MLIASPPQRRVTQRVEGGSQPEGPGSRPSRRHALITNNGKRPQKSSLPHVTKTSSTGNISAASASVNSAPRRRCRRGRGAAPIPSDARSLRRSRMSLKLLPVPDGGGAASVRTPLSGACVGPTQTAATPADEGRPGGKSRGVIRRSDARRFPDCGPCAGARRDKFRARAPMSQIISTLYAICFRSPPRSTPHSPGAPRPAITTM